MRRLQCGPLLCTDSFPHSVAPRFLSPVRLGCRKVRTFVISDIALVLYFLVSGSNDTEFEESHRHFTQLEQAAEKLIKDTKAFCQAVTGDQPQSRLSLAINFISYSPPGDQFSLQSHRPLRGQLRICKPYVSHLIANRRRVRSYWKAPRFGALHSQRDKV